MNEQEKFELLSKVDAFQGLNENDINDLAKLATTIKIEKGDILFKEEDSAHSLYIVYTGVISIIKGSRELAQISSGNMIGEMSLLDSGSRSATAKAKENSILLEVSEKSFQNLLGNQNLTLLKILKVLSKRIRDSDQKLAIDHMIMTTLIHDLNNSLTCFSVASLINKYAEPNSKIQDYSKIILAAQKSIQEMIQSALHSYRTNQFISNKNELDMKKTITQTCQIHIANHPDIKKIILEVILPEKNEKVLHNANDLIRVLSNLVINAAQASKEGQKVILKLDFKPKLCEIIVKDQGSGIPEKIKKSIFLPGSTSKPTGNGLGLYSCQNIVEKMHGGSISFDSEEGKGTEFTIRLPIS